jgi:uncharacterized protein YprB with RNaseH-like and TPR domain
MAKIQRLTLDDVKKGASVGVWDIEAMGLNAGFGYMLVSGIAPLNCKKKSDVHITRISDFHGPRDTKNYWNDSEMVVDTIEQLKKFEYVVTYNGKWYDAAFTITRAIRTGIEWSLVDTKHVDVYQLNRKRFRVNNRSLEGLIIHLDCQMQKTKLRPQTWARAGCGNVDAIEEIVIHNIQDVLSLAEATRKILKTTSIPWQYIR